MFISKFSLVQLISASHSKLFVLCNKYFFQMCLPKKNRPEDLQHLQIMIADRAELCKFLARTSSTGWRHAAFTPSFETVWFWPSLQTIAPDIDLAESWPNKSEICFTPLTRSLTSAGFFALGLLFHSTLKKANNRGRFYYIR